MTKLEQAAMRQGLNTILMLLEHYVKETSKDDGVAVDESIAAMREALAEPDYIEANGGRTGWPPGLLQDDCRKLGKWFAGKPDARQKVREALAGIVEGERMAIEQQQPAKFYPHKWGKDGERCVICGDKDWMGTSCKKPADDFFNQFQTSNIRKPAKHHCGDACQHASDCAVHRGPAYPEGPCNCEVSQAKHQEELNKFAEDSVWDGEGP